ncbi:Transmembrane protein [Trema orientale]|uniref:Transmembrane protein n=1 Tax=Trema orientale TaxID=63057 RepID=A0A2P5F6U6_TREOI|nr:Transmembrane protein [Trema orientale]
MGSQQKGEEEQQLATSSNDHKGWNGMLVDKYRQAKEHAETYPYVWASYIVVYGGFALWTTYRWRKLRKTEDRIRVLQERLRKLVEAEESSASGAASSASSSSAKNARPPVDKASK